MHRILRSLALLLALALGMLPALHAQTVAPRRVSLRVAMGAAVPVAPSQFRSDWNPGFNTAASAAYSVSPPVELALAVEYGSFGVGEAPASPPGSTTTRHASPLWAAWFNGAFTASAGQVRPRVLVGAGVVAHGSARTAPALQIGVGVERSLGTRIAASLEAAIVYAFTTDPTGQAAIAEPLSYAPIRIGLVWR